MEEMFGTIENVSDEIYNSRTNLLDSIGFISDKLVKIVKKTNVCYYSKEEIGSGFVGINSNGLIIHTGKPDPIGISFFICLKKIY